MFVIKVSLCQPGWFHGLKVEWNTTDHDNKIRYKHPFIPLKVTATCNIFNHTPMYFISLLASIRVYHRICSQNMSMNGSPPKTANMSPPGGQVGTPQCCEDNSDSSGNILWTATGQDSRFGIQTNQYPTPHGYCYLPSHQPFPIAQQFHQHSTFNTTHSLQPTTSASQGDASYRPQWQGYDLHQVYYCGSQMVPPPQN